MRYRRAMTIEVSDLCVARGDVKVLSGVTFSVAAGEALIVRGRNGGGKTTLLRVLAGLAPPVSGTIDAPEDAIAYAGHADGLKAQLTVAENLKFWASVFANEDMKNAIEAFDLYSLMERRAGDLSAGQKRRLSLARLLVTGRAIWCLDEPTVSLDQENVARFAVAVEAHLARGGSAIIATHIDLGLPNARTLDITPFIARDRAAPVRGDTPLDPFLEGERL